jgi:sec-independent protein translocase protein TatC
MSAQPEFDEDDYFHDTRMSFGDHLEVLRKHLWRAIYGLLICMVIGFVLDAFGKAIDNPYIGIGKPLMDIIQDPVRKALVEFYDNRKKDFEDRAAKDPTSVQGKAREAQDFPLTYSGQELEKLRGLSRDDLAKLKNVPIDQIPDSVTVSGKYDPLLPWMHNNEIERLIRPRELSAMSAQESFVIYFKVSLIAGLVIASPWVFWQIWSFIAAGLYPNEKKYVHLYLPISVGLFILGVVLCQFMVMPRTVGALLWFNEFLGVTPELRLSEWLTLAILVPLIFGISFQTPLVMLFVERIGLMDAAGFRRYRKIAIFSMAVFAAVVTPTPDAITMCCLWVPMCLLYELGIFLCVFSPNKKRGLDGVDVPESDELIEV